MHTDVHPESLGVAATSLARVAAELAEARQQLSAVHARSTDLGRAGAAAAHETWRSADRALTGVSESVSSLGDALRLLATVYADVERGAVR
ncbi:MAG: hypothetical protein QOJ92_997 [Frankiales bacterium]|nr:hypothetical protein [Frankiales bacterium]